MKRIFMMLRRSIVILLGFIWGAVSFFWLGYSILTIGNLIEEPGSLDYEWEGEHMRIFGLIGCVLYVVVFACIVCFLKRQKPYSILFLLSMLVSGIILISYLFVFRA